MKLSENDRAFNRAFRKWLKTGTSATEEAEDGGGRLVPRELQARLLNELNSPIEGRIVRVPLARRVGFWRRAHGWIRRLFRTERP